MKLSKLKNIRWSTRRLVALALVMVGMISVFFGLWLNRYRILRPVASSTRYDDIIQDVAARHNLPPALIKAVIKRESRFQQMAVGDAGEVGLMQITDPAVTDWKNRTGNRKPFKFMLFDPRLNIEIGAWYLAHVRDRYQAYKHADALALAAYNAGPSNAYEWKPEKLSDSFIERIEFDSTAHYVKEVLKFRNVYQEKGLAYSETENR